MPLRQRCHHPLVPNLPQVQRKTALFGKFRLAHWRAVCYNKGYREKEGAYGLWDIYRR